jgi:hypothetical protein
MTATKLMILAQQLDDLLPELQADGCVCRKLHPHEWGGIS